MDPKQFQLWKGETLEKMVQLSTQQLEELLTDFVQCSSLQQREFLYQDLQYILTQDIMDLPAALRNQIFQWLDIKSLLSLRLVCHAWRNEICQLDLWKRECVRSGGLVPSKCCQHPDGSCHYYFNFYLRLVRVLRLVAAGQAFVICCPENESQLRSVAFCPVACSNLFLACGISHKGLAGLDMVGAAVRWEKAGSLVSCVYSNSDLVLAGSYSGQLRVVSHNGDIDHKLQVHSCAVHAVDVHKSGLYLLIGYLCGIVHLIDENLKFFTLDVGLHQRDDVKGSHNRLGCPGVKVVSVKFLPEPCIRKNLLAISVCFEHYMAFALVDKATGDVTEKFISKKTVSPLSSYCLTASDPCVAYASEGDENTLKINVWRFQVGFVQLQQYSRQLHEVWKTDTRETVTDIPVLQIDAVRYHITDDSPLFIIAAGKRFLIAAMLCDIVIFDVENFTKLATVNDFLGNSSMRQIYLNRGENSLCAVNTEWLDGLDPSNTKPDQLLLIFMRMNLVTEHSVIKTLRWDSRLWNSVGKAVPVEVCIPHFCDLKTGGREEASDLFTKNLDSSHNSPLFLPDGIAFGIESKAAANKATSSVMNADSRSMVNENLLLYKQQNYSNSNIISGETGSSNTNDIRKRSYDCSISSDVNASVTETKLHTKDVNVSENQIYHRKVLCTASYHENKQIEVIDFQRTAFGMWKNAELFHKTVLNLRDHHPALYIERN